MNNTTTQFFESITGAWILIIITKLLSGNYIEETILFESDSFDIKLESILVGIYMLLILLVWRRLIGTKQ